MFPLKGSKEDSPTHPTRSSKSLVMNPLQTLDFISRD